MRTRLQKYLADNGVASRRKCEKYITDGLIKVNGAIVKKLGTTIDPQIDKVEIADCLHFIKAKYAYYLLHKPVGYVCSVTGPEEPKVMELVRAIPERIFPVGRLDKLTAGLLIMTNDGRFAYELTHPKFKKEKEYVVKVREKISQIHTSIMQKPFMINGRLTQPATIITKGPHLFNVILREGRNRQIRRMCERASLHVERLKRIRLGSLQLGTLISGEYRKLLPEEVNELRNR